MNNIKELILASGVAVPTGEMLMERFGPFLDQVAEWKAKSATLKVTRLDQLYEMKMAGEARKALKAVRLNADQMRKALKEESNRYNNAVQGIYNFIEGEIKPIEAFLADQEKFIEREQEKRRIALRAAREAELAPYNVAIFAGLDEMAEDDYQALLTGAKTRHAEALKAEEEARKKAAEEAAEQARIREENIRLQQEIKDREAREERVRKETEAHMAKLAAEAAAREEAVRKEEEGKRDAELKRLAAEAKVREDKIKEEAAAQRKAEADRFMKEAEAKRKAEAEQARLAEVARLKAEQEAIAKRSDYDKLVQLGKDIKAIQIPEVGENYKVLVKVVKDDLERALTSLRTVLTGKK